MRMAPLQHPREHLRPDRLPRAIWMPAHQHDLPSCYQGTPLQMVQEMARYMKPGLGVHDAIDLLLRSLADERDVRIELHSQGKMPEEARASMFIYALLFSGVAREMPQA